MGRSKIRPVCDRGVKLVLHSFTRETDGTVTNGAFPEAGQIFDSNGALYGTTSTGGRSKNVTFPRFNAAFCRVRGDSTRGRNEAADDCSILRCRRTSYGTWM